MVCARVLLFVFVVLYLFGRLNWIDRTLRGVGTRQSIGSERHSGSPSNVSLKVRVAVVLIVILIIGSLSLSQAVAMIPTGNRGVVLEWGRVVGVMDEGLNWKLPFAQTVELIDITIQRSETPEDAATLDLQTVTTTIAVNYRLNPAYVAEIYQTLRHDYEERVVKPNIEESIKATTDDFTAEELITKREAVKTKFKQILSERLDQFHINVVEVSITDFQFSDAFKNAVDEKVTAEQLALKAKNELERVRYEAQQQVIQAEAEANATRARAKAEADARLVQATAEAEAIQLIQAQIAENPEYLQYVYIEQWDGVLPYYYGGDQLPFLLLPASTNSTTP